MPSLENTVQSHAPLGQKSAYPTRYDNTLLFPVMRSEQRSAMQFPDIQWRGVDIWNAYELAWLNKNGMPQRALASFYVPAHSPVLAESKSVKLYLNSLNHERFDSETAVKDLIEKDLSAVCQASVRVVIDPPALDSLVDNADFICLDDQTIALESLAKDPQILSFGTDIVEEKLVTHVFKSHCLVTGQPDWGSIFIEYRGHAIDRANLMRYLVSFSNHRGFSENCVEQIFIDLLERGRPSKLTVFGQFTRRGGIDINPYRTTGEIMPLTIRLRFQ